MPYLSGPTICDISNQFGFPATYARNGGGKSRWAYFDELLEYCINNNRISALFTFLFSKNQFVEKLRGCEPGTIEAAHQDIINMALENINSILYFSNNTLSMAGNQFRIHSINETIPIETPTVKKIDRAYIRDLAERALKDIEDLNYDSAISKARTILEEVFCYVIEQREEEPIDSGDIGKLYNQVKSLFNMHQSKETDKRINMLLSGLEKVVSAITEMRNKGGDSHGLGSRRINIKNYHALLVVNAATTMADFILSVEESAKTNPTLPI